VPFLSLPAPQRGVPQFKGLSARPGASCSRIGERRFPLKGYGV
jgi:hypothetical protein